MGVVDNVSADKWPKQGNRLGRPVDVCFRYDTSCQVRGVIVRDDMEDPGRTIIHLVESDRYVLATECMYGTASPENDPVGWKGA